MEDDFFSDLLGSQGSKQTKLIPTPSPPTPSPFLSSVSSPVDNSAAAHDKTGGADGKHESSEKPGVVQMSAADLKGIVEKAVNSAVQEAVDSSLAKFAKSLRTVLENVSRRIDIQGNLYSELRQSVLGLKDQQDDHANNIQARFTAVDVALKDIERGVQAMRDRQELVEAQAMLANLSRDKLEESAHAGSSGGAAPAPAATTPAPVSAPQQPTVPVTPLPVPVPAQAPPPPAPALPPAAPQQPAPPAPAPPVPVMATQLAPQQPNVMLAQPPAQNVPASPGYQMQAPQMQAPHQLGAPQEQYQAQAPTQYAQMQPPQAPQPPAAGPPPQAQGPNPGYAYSAPNMPQQGGNYPSSQPPPAPTPAAPAPNPPHPMPNYQQQAPYSGAPPMGNVPPQMGNMGPSLQPTSSGPTYPAPSGPTYPAPSGPSYPAPSYAAYPQAPTSNQGPPANSYQRAPPPMPSNPAMMQQQPGMQPGQQPRTSSRPVPLEVVINDIQQMGFDRPQIMAIINQLQRSGQSVDLNVILDRLTNGGRY